MKSFAHIVLMASCLLATDVDAQCVVGNCEEGLGYEYKDPRIGSTVSYIGDFSRGEKTGCATIIKGSTYYFGQVLRGKKHGLGIEHNGKQRGTKEGRWESGRFVKEIELNDRDSLCAPPNFP